MFVSVTFKETDFAYIPSNLRQDALIHVTAYVLNLPPKPGKPTRLQTVTNCFGQRGTDINELFLITLLENIDYTDTAGKQ